MQRADMKDLFLGIAWFVLGNLALAVGIAVMWFRHDAFAETVLSLFVLVTSLGITGFCWFAGCVTWAGRGF